MSAVGSSSHNTSLHAVVFSPSSSLSAAPTAKASLIKASQHRGDPWIQDQTGLLLVCYWSAHNMPFCGVLGGRRAGGGQRAGKGQDGAGTGGITALPLGAAGDGRARGGRGVGAERALQPLVLQDSEMHFSLQSLFF